MINCIVAVEKNQGIGYKGSMPWPHLKEDLKFFKEKTMNNVIIMGRQTWESIGSKNLPNRINIVVSRNQIEGCHVSCSNTADALEYSIKNFPSKEIFIIGGEAIYSQYIDIIDKFYVTEIDGSFKCDKFFDFDYVKKECKIVNVIAEYKTPIPFTIKEYQYE